MHRYLWPVALLVASAVVLLAPAAGEAGGPPVIAWSPTTSPGTFDFGAVKVGDTPSQTFTLTNSGGSAPGALTITFSGSAAFSITSDACTGTSLGPRKSCAVTVEYAPTAAGASDTATLTATGKKPSGRSASITLTGSGAVPPVHIYWTNANIGTIGRADLDGNNANQSVITTASAHPGGVAVDGSHIYWTRANFGTIGRADLDGNNVNQSFITGAPNPGGVAVDGSHIYWTNGS